MERVNCEDKKKREQNTIKKRALLSYPAYIYPHEQSSSCLLYMGKSSRFNNLFLSSTHTHTLIERGHDNNQQNKKEEEI